jgi:integrase
VGEAVGPQVRDIDFLHRRLTVVDNIVQANGEHIKGDTRSRKVRSVPVPEFILNELPELCRGRRRDAFGVPAQDGLGPLHDSAENGWWLVRWCRQAVGGAASPRTICDTPARPWRCLPGSMC